MRYLTVVTVMFLLACGEAPPTTAQANDGVISAVEFKKEITDLESVHLVDVRTPEEFAEGHIQGAQNINYFDEDFTTQISQLDTLKPVYLYCRSGNRSGKTYVKLKELGYPRVFDLEGGYSAWPDK